MSEATAPLLASDPQLVETPLAVVRIAGDENRIPTRFDGPAAIPEQLAPPTPSGQLFYGERGYGIEMVGRSLAHLHVLILTKLRRGESFAFTWATGPNNDGRSSIWLNPAIPLQFVFAAGPSPILNRAWIEALMVTANSAGGLTLTAEP